VGCCGDTDTDVVESRLHRISARMLCCLELSTTSCKVCLKKQFDG
jgi:hypothetical protein